LRVVLGFCGIAFGSAAIAFAAAGVNTESAVAFGAVALLMGIVLAMFHALTIRVSRCDVELSFGIGLIRKRFDLNAIQSASVVRTRWYHGWGIKKIRGGWLYNVSGFDAVEIQLANAHHDRIGTDEPDKLLAAIQSARGALAETAPSAMKG
jgi:hypothetical protein